MWPFYVPFASNRISQIIIWIANTEVVIQASETAMYLGMDGGGLVMAKARSNEGNVNTDTPKQQGCNIM